MRRAVLHQDLDLQIRTVQGQVLLRPDPQELLLGHLRARTPLQARPRRRRRPLHRLDAGLRLPRHEPQVGWKSSIGNSNPKVVPQALFKDFR